MKDRERTAKNASRTVKTAPGGYRWRAKHMWSGRDDDEASLRQVLLDFKTGRPAAHPEPRVLLISGLKRGRVLLCVLPSKSSHATTSLTSHENLLGNCFAKAVVIVSAMT
jgi:hypothetical protein